MTAKLWTNKAAERTRRSVKTLLATRARKSSAADALRYAATQVLLREGDTGELQQMVRFFYALEALSQHAQSGGLAPRHVTALLGHAREVLQKQGIVAGKSKLGHLHAELESLQGKLEAAKGDAWSAAVRRFAGIDALKRSTAVEAGIFHSDWGQSLLRLGDADAALRAFDEALARGVNAEVAASLEVVRIRAVRLAGRAEDARKLLAERTDDDAMLGWERVVLSCHGTNDYRPLATVVRKSKAFYEPEKICVALLYNLAGEHHVERALMPRIESIIRRRDLRWDFDSALLKMCRSLDELEARRAAREVVTGEEVLSLLANVRELTDVEHELLAYACAARLLVRLQVFPAAALVLRRYRSVSMALSRGQSIDVLGLVTPLMGKGWFIDAESGTMQSDDSIADTLNKAS